LVAGQGRRLATIASMRPVLARVGEAKPVTLS
jgi:hypothetical protein